MSENTSNEIQPGNGKPVNINISFNISRKQVTQNINSLDNEKSFNLKNTNIEENPNTINKPKINTSRPLKTPQLAQTDRHVYSKELEYPRATEQLKRKKRRKRNSVDYTIDKTNNAQFFPIDLDKSLPMHKRGYTTTIGKKNQSNAKNKKQTSKTYQNVKQSDTVPISAILNHGTKTQGKTLKLEKNLKNILNKLINNQLSKRSLPLPSVPSKSKYNQSTALTARKITNTKPTKKRSSKSHILTKQRANSSSNINSSRSEMQLFQNPKILEKLGNFKSIENSVLVSQADNNDDNEKYVNENRLKNYQQKRIVIKTDQSIECIGQIHDWQRNYYKEQFFHQEPGKKTKVNNFIMNKKGNQLQQKDKSSQNTINLIETYVKLLNSNNGEQFYETENRNGDSYDAVRNEKREKERRSNSNIPHNVNERVDIYEDNQQHMSTEDYFKIQELLRSSKNKIDKFQNIIQESDKLQAEKRNKRLYYQPEETSQRVNPKKESIRVKQTHSFEQQQPSHLTKQNLNQKSPSYPQCKQTPLYNQQKHHNYQNKQSQQHFRPFMSSQMGRDIVNYTNTNTQERQKINKLKKHEFQKWSSLLEYIKSNINNDKTNTQQVLQQVYEYLSKAKTDLIKEGENIVAQVHQNGINSSSGNNKRQNKNKDSLEEEFTNKLSEKNNKNLAQLPQSKGPKIVDYKGSENNDEIEENSYKKSKQFHSNKRKVGQLMRSQQQEEQEILEQQTKSFKQEYESSSVDEGQLKFMNLSTIEAALKSRYNQLLVKKEKQIEKLEELLSQQQIDEKQYEQKLVQIQQKYRKQTNEIISVKRNIWKGYNEARGILEKSYITSRVEEQFGCLNKELYVKNYGSESKDGRMMRCLSESYLGRKKIDYRKFIEEEEKKRQVELENRLYSSGQKVLKRQQNEDQQQQQQHSYQPQSSQPSSYDQQQQQEQPHYEQQKSQNLGDLNQGSNNNNLLDEELDQITEKINKLKEQHDKQLHHQSKSQSPQSINAALQEDSQQQKKIMKESFQIKNTLVKEFNLYTENSLISSSQKESQQYIPGSPVMVSVSPNSSMHYEEIQRSLHAYSSEESSHGQYQEDVDEKEKEESYGEKSSNQYSPQVENKQSSSQQQQQRSDIGSQSDYQDSKEQSNEEEQDQTQPLGQDQTQNKFEQQEEEQNYQQNYDHQLEQEEEQYSDQQKQILAREINGIDRQKVVSKSKNQLKQQENYQKTQIKKQSKQKPKKQQDPKIKALIKKFKYLTEQDRQDIFEFLFLDLCIELYQQPCHENKLMDSINKHVAKQHELSKRKKGVKTNLNVVKDYLKRFCGYLLRTNKQALDNMNVPMGPTAVEMLKYMHENQDFDDAQADQNDGVVTLIIPVSIFDTFERSLLPTLQFEKYYDNDQKEHERVNFLKNILHIHNKALFDALNEFLDQQRPFGIWGKPFPWKKSSSFSHKFTEIEQQQKLKKSAQKVVEACSYVCGLLIDKEQSLVGNSKISQGYIEQIREDRISRMLANQMIENEERWVFYDDEQTQVLVEASNFVYNFLLKEALQELVKLVDF